MRAAQRRVDELERSNREATARARSAEAEAVRLRRALDSMPQGVVVCDESGRVVFRNRHAAALVDARHADALAARAVEDLLEEAGSGTAGAVTLELHGPPARTLVLTGAAIDGDGGSMGAIAVIDDVSDRRHLEDVRRDFVANVSHELRTPVGALAVLAETLGGEADPHVVERLAGRIRTEAERVGRIIEDLLDLSRIEAQGAAAEEAVAVASVVSGAIERVRPLAERRRVDIRVLDELTELAVVGDERQLVSAVANLLDNGVKYSDPGGCVEVLAAGDGVWTELVVRDRGIGIPNKDLERIFERFYRVDRARSRQTGGTGLGLAIVRHVATNHGGEVLVTSQEGQGSTFTVRLPAPRAHEVKEVWAQ